MNTPSPVEDVLDRLEVLRHKCEQDGMYVRADTCTMAIEEIRFLRTPAQEPTPTTKQRAHVPAQHEAAGQATVRNAGVTAGETAPSAHDLAVDALESLLHQLDLTPPDFDTHPELCAAIDAAKEDLLTIKTQVFSDLSLANSSGVSAASSTASTSGR